MNRLRGFLFLLLASGSCFGQLPVVHEFSCDHLVARPGDAMRLFWNVEGATQVTISGGVGVVSPTEVGEVLVNLPADSGAGFAPELIPQGAVWKFDDSSVDLGTAWRFESFDDSGWNEGVGEFGFGEASAVTNLNRERGMQEPVYFRKQLEIDYLDEDVPVTFRFKRDDGIVIWINGVELLRDNMPPGEVGFDALPLMPVLNEADWVPVELGTVGSIFREGTNTVAVSLHQIHRTSSDMRFDFDLNYAGPVTPQFVYTLTATNLFGSVVVELPVEVELRGEPDYDRDGLPDEWEALNFGNLDGFGADDPDGDGLTNFEEFDQSRLPHVRGTGLRLESMGREAGLIRLEMPLFYGRDLGVEYSRDLSDGSWRQLGNFFSEGGKAVFIDPDGLRAQRENGYYRAFLRTN